MKRYTVVEIEMDRKQEHKKKRVEKLEKKNWSKIKLKDEVFSSTLFLIQKSILLNFNQCKGRA